MTQGFSSSLVIFTFSDLYIYLHKWHSVFFSKVQKVWTSVYLLSSESISTVARVTSSPANISDEEK